MKVMKKILYILISFILFFLITSCGKASFSVEFNLNGGKINNQENIIEKFQKNEKITYPNPVREGYILKGWSYEIDGDIKSDIIANKNLKLYAIWQKNDNFKKYFKLTIPSSITILEPKNINKDKILEDSIIKFLINIPTDKRIDKLLVNGKEIYTSNNEFEIKIKENTIIMVEFKEKVVVNTYRLDLPQTNVVVKSDISHDLTKVVENSRVILEFIIPDENKNDLMVVKKNGVVVEINNNLLFFNMTKDTIITQEFIKKTKTHKIVIPENIKVLQPKNIDLSNVLTNTKIDFEITIPENKKIDKLIVNNVEQELNLNTFSLVVVENTIISVSFVDKINTYYLRLSDNIFVIGDPIDNLEKINEGTQVKLLINIPENKKLESLKINNQKIDNPIDNTLTISLYENTDIVATLIDKDVEIYHSVTLNMTEYIKVASPNNIDLSKVLDKTKITFNILNRENYALSEIKINNESIQLNNTIEVIVDKDINIEITYQEIIKKYYTLSISENIEIISPTITDTNKILENTNLILKVKIKQGKYLKSLIVNNSQYIPGVDVDKNGQFSVLIIKNTVIVDEIDDEVIKLKYTVENDKVVVHGLIDETTTHLVIPNTINNMPVYKIAARAFRLNKNLTDVLIGENVEIIDNEAFMLASSLSNITLPQSLKKIGNYAIFQTGIQSINIPNLEYIGFKAFASNDNLSNVVIDQNNLKINKYTFSDTPYYNSIAKVSDYKIINNIAVEYFNTTSAVIKTPENIKALGQGLYDQNTKLTKVVVSEGVKYIGDNSFRANISLIEVSLPQSLEEIGLYSFARSINLRNISIPSTVSKIGKGAFKNTSISTITIPEKVKVLNDYLFADNKYLNNISIPNDIEHVGYHVFENTPFLQQKTHANKFYQINNILIRATQNKQGDQIPNNIVEIAPGAFENNNSRMTIYIPKKVEKIGYRAFYNTKFENIRFNGQTSYVDKQSFIFAQKELPYIQEVSFEYINSKPDTWDDNWYSAYVKNDKFNIRWSLISAVSFDLNGGDSSEISTQEIQNHSFVTIPNQPTRQGYVFIGWHKDNKLYDFEQPVLESFVLTAKWALKDASFDFEFLDKGSAKLVGYKNDTTKNEVLIPNKFMSYPVTQIGNNVFENMTNITNITLPNTLTYIGDSAFKNTSITNITIPTSVSHLGDKFIENTPYLNNLIANNNMVIINKILVDASKLSGDIEINTDDISIVNYRAFENNKNVTKVTFTDTNKLTILDRAFNNTSNLLEVVIYDNIFKIGKYAFSNSNSNLLVKFPNTYIPKQTFDNNWDNNDKGAVINTEFKNAIYYTITMPDNVELVDKTLDISKILDRTSVEFIINIPDYQKIKQVIVNGVDVIFTKNTFTYTVNNNIEIKTVLDAIDSVKDEFNKEFEKIKTSIGIDPTADGTTQQKIIESIGYYVNRKIINLEVEKIDEKNYTVKAISTRVSYITKSINIKIFESKDLNDTAVISSLSSYDGNYKAENILDKNIETKWVDSTSSDKYVVIKLQKIVTLNKIIIDHAQYDNHHGNSNTVEENTKAFEVLLSEDNISYVKIADVFENTRKQTIHEINDVLAQYIKIIIHQGARHSNSRAIIRGVLIFGLPKKANVAFNLNGGISSDNTNISILKGYTIDSSMIPNVSKDHFIFEKWQLNGLDFDIENTKVYNDLELVAKYKIEDSLLTILNTELSKINNSIIMNTQSQLTNNLVKIEIEKLVDLAKVSVNITNSSTNKYLVKLISNLTADAHVSKEIEFYTTDITQKSNVTFNLNGGNISNNTDNIVVKVFNGTKLDSNSIPTNIVKEDFNFVGWQLDNKDVTVEDIIIVKDIELIAKYNIKDEVLVNINAEILKIPKIIAYDNINDITIENIKNKVKTHIDTNTYNVDVLHDTDNIYNIQLTNKLKEYIKKSISINADLKLNITKPVSIKLMDPIVKNIETIITITETRNIVKSLIIDNEELKYLIKDNKLKYTFTKDSQIHVVYDAPISDYNIIDNEINKIKNGISISNSQVDEQSFIDALKSQIDASQINISTVEKIGYFHTTFTLKTNALATRNVDIPVLSITELNSFASVYSKSSENSNASEYASNAIDNNSDNTANLNTKWVSLNSTGYIVIEFSKMVYLSRVVITHAGNESSDFITRGFKIGYFTEQYQTTYPLDDTSTLFKTETNTDGISISDFARTNVKYVKIEITQAQQQSNGVIRIRDIRFYDNIQSHKVIFDLNGGSVNSDYSNIKQYITHQTLVKQANIPTVVKTNYTFIGFYDSNNILVDFNSKFIKKDEVFTAKFQRNQNAPTDKVKVKFDLSGGNIDGNNSIYEIDVFKNEKIDKQLVKIPIKENMIFKNWNYNNKEFDMLTNITIPITLKANYIIDPNLINVVDEELNKIPNKFTLSNATTDELKLEIIKNEILKHIDITKVDINIKLENSVYIVELMHKLFPQILNTKIIDVNFLNSLNDIMVLSNTTTSSDIVVENIQNAYDNNLNTSAVIRNTHQSNSNTFKFKLTFSNSVTLHSMKFIFTPDGTSGSVLNDKGKILFGEIVGNYYGAISNGEVAPTTNYKFIEKGFVKKPVNITELVIEIKLPPNTALAIFDIQVYN